MDIFGRKCLEQIFQHILEQLPRTSCLQDVGNDSMDAGGRATQDAKAEGREHDYMDAGGTITGCNR